MGARAKVLLAIVAAAALALVIALLFDRGERASSAVAAPRSSAAVAAVREPVAEPSAPLSDAPQTTPPVTRVATARGESDPAMPPRLPTGRLDVHVVWADTHEPRAGLGVTLVPVLRGGLYFTREGRSDEQGLAHFDRVEAGPVVVMGDRSGQVEAEVEVGRLTEATLEVARGCRVEGRVVVSGGASVSQAEVWLERDGWLRRIAECDSTQHFVVEGLEPGGRVFARAREWWSSNPLLIKDCNAVATPIELAIDRQGALVLGQVLDPDERPVVGAVVAVEVRATGGFLQLGKTYLTAVTDDEGRFSLPGADNQQRLVVSAPQFAPYETVLDCSQPGARIQHIAQLEPGATLIGRIAASDGKPVRGVLVLSGDFLHDGMLLRVAISDEKGNYKLCGLAPGPNKIRAYSGRVHDDGVETELELTAGQTSVWNPVVEPPPDDATSRAK